MVAHDPERQRPGPAVSLILPTYNAAAFLGRTWKSVCRFLDGTAEPWEVLFVCDGCTDGSPELLAQLIGPDRSDVRILSYPINRGKGHAVRMGLNAARASRRIFTDVDLAYGFDDIHRVAEALRAGAEVAIASRHHAESRVVVPPQLQGYAYRRHLQSLAFSALVRCLLPLSQRDTQAGLKGFTTRAVERILPHLHCDGFGFDCELLMASRWQGLAIVEVPVTMRFESSASTTGLHNMRYMLQELWLIRRSWRQRQGLAGLTEQTGRRAA